MTPAPTYTHAITSKDGLALFAQGWLPEGEPTASILITHGYGEHSGRYAALAGHLTAQGHAVHTFDLRGFGRSEGRRAFVSSFEVYLEDLDVCLQAVRADIGTAPLFLMGHSMGGTICTLYTLAYPDRAAGLILSSPALRSNEAPLLQKFATILGRFLPSLPTILLDRRLISRDPAVVAQAEADPLNYHGRILARTGAELLRAMRQIEAEGEKLMLPLLIFHGTGDRLTDPTASVDLYNRVRSTDKTLSLYERLFHETFNEPERAQVLEELTEWLEEHTSPNTQA